MTVHTSRFRHAFLYAAALCLLPALVKLICYRNYLGSDDSYIHLQVVRNIYTHSFWGINPGVRCNLSTSPLFTILLLGFHLLFHSHDAVAMQIASCLAAGLGLLAIFTRIFKTTARNLTAAFLGLGVAALSCNLWRWTGTVMETAFAFCAVALILLCFSSYRFTPRRALGAGLLLGLSVLLRPELLALAGVCLGLTLWFNTTGRLRTSLCIGAGMIAPMAAWYVFSYSYFHAIFPTTYHAKTAGYWVFWNPLTLQEYGSLLLMALLWPAILLAGCVYIAGIAKLRKLPPTLLLPLFGALPSLAFYYLRMVGLDSPGRDLLPLFPLFAVLAAELLALAMEKKPAIPWNWVVASVLALHCVTNIYANMRFIAPALSSFHSQYFATMQNAAEYLAAHAQPKDRVLVEIDIGVLAYCANGRFVIADGGGLASPELAHKSVDEQIAISQPKFLIESQGEQANDWQGQYGGLQPLWHAAYKGHGVSSPKELFANIYQLPAAK